MTEEHDRERSPARERDIPPCGRLMERSCVIRNAGRRIRRQPIPHVIRYCWRRRSHGGICGVPHLNGQAVDIEGCNPRSVGPRRAQNRRTVGRRSPRVGGRNGRGRAVRLRTGLGIPPRSVAICGVRVRTARTRSRVGRATHDHQRKNQEQVSYAAHRLSLCPAPASTHVSLTNLRTRIGRKRNP